MGQPVAQLVLYSYAPLGCVAIAKRALKIFDFFFFRQPDCATSPGPEIDKRIIKIIIYYLKY